MNTKQQYLISTLKTLGFDTENKSFEKCFELLIEEHIRICMEIEVTNKEFFRKELNRILKPTN